jgi:hypothetical protein
MEFCFVTLEGSSLADHIQFAMKLSHLHKTRIALESRIRLLHLKIRTYPFRFDETRKDRIHSRADCKVRNSFHNLFSIIAG